MSLFPKKEKRTRFLALKVVVALSPVLFLLQAGFLEGSLHSVTVEDLDQGREWIIKLAFMFHNIGNVLQGNARLRSSPRRPRHRCSLSRLIGYRISCPQRPQARPKQKVTMHVRSFMVSLGNAEAVERGRCIPVCRGIERYGGSGDEGSSRALIV